MSEADAVVANTPEPEEPEIILDEEPEAEPDEAELEIGPDKVKVPKAVKEAWDGLQKKVQSTAEETKAEKAKLAQERETFVSQAKALSAVQDEWSELKGINAQLEPYLKLTPQDWMAWAAQDSEKAQQAQMAVQALLMKRQTLDSSIRTKVGDLQAQEARTQAEAKAKAEQEFNAKIKDWTPQREEALIKVAVDSGVSPDDVKPLLRNPSVIQILQDAMLYRQAKAKAAARKVESEPAPAPEPVKTPRGTSASSAGDMRDTASMESFQKAFLKQRLQHKKK